MQSYRALQGWGSNTEIAIHSILSGAKTVQLVYTTARSSEYLERKAPAFFATFKLLEFSKNYSNMVCTSPKKQQISRVSRVWLKNYACHALLKFEIVLAGNPF